MAEIFDITTDRSAVTLRADGAASISFTVRNPSAAERGVRFDIVPLTKTDTSWFEVKFQDGKKIPAGGSVTVNVEIKVPADRRKEKHEFKLQAVDPSDPRGDHVQSRSISLGGAPPPPWGMMIGIAACVIVIIVVAVILLTHGKSVAVPDLMNKPIEEARTIVHNLGLTITETQAVPADPNQKPGTVIDQTPKSAAGGALKKGAAVAVVTAQAPAGPTPAPLVPVPQLAGSGMLFEDAKAKAESLGLKLTIDGPPLLIDELPNSIHEQNPRSDTGVSITRGSAIFVKVVANWIKVPSITSKTVNEAMQICNLSGFLLDLAHAQVARGLTIELNSNVSSQNPAANSLLVKQAGVIPQITPTIGSGIYIPIDPNIWKDFIEKNSSVRMHYFMNGGGGQ